MLGPVNGVCSLRRHQGVGTLVSIVIDLEVRCRKTPACQGGGGGLLPRLGRRKKGEKRRRRFRGSDVVAVGARHCSRGDLTL